jgi:Helix-turn-helix domain
MSDRIKRLDSFATFGDLLKYLRTRARLTQRDFSIAVGYSEAHISRLESNKRVPKESAIMVLFVPALRLEDEPQMVTQLLGLAGKVREPSLSAAVSRQEQVQPVPGARAKHHNLPAELTSLVGRETDLAEIERLLTLTDAGGCGKTRLALRTGRNLARQFPHGAWRVELAPLSDPAMVVQAFVSALGLAVSPNDRPIDILTAFFQDASCC